MAQGLYKMSPFKFWQAALVSGAISAYGGWRASKRAKREQTAAKADMQRSQQSWMDFDLSNPYANMENVYEDLTVNQQAAQFQSQQAAQSRADILSGLQGAAGGAGVAGLAQAMAQQGTLQAQQASASIGQQESMNQRLRAQGAAGVQQYERYGADLQEQRQFGRLGTLFGMDMQRVTAANEARATAQTQMYAGLGKMAGGIATGYQKGAFDNLLNKTTLPDLSNTVEKGFRYSEAGFGVGVGGGGATGFQQQLNPSVAAAGAGGDTQQAIQSGQQTIMHDGQMYSLKPDGMGGGQYVDILGNVLQL